MNPVSFEEQQRMDSKNLIEEYMLLANQFVAEFIVKYCKDKALIRNQLPPEDGDRLQSFENYCQRIGIEMNLASSWTIQESFDKLKQLDDTKIYENVV